MLFDELRDLLVYPQHGDDRRAGAGHGVGLPRAGRPASGKPPILRRRTITLIAIFGIAVILYGTLMPFEFRPGKTLNWRLDRCSFEVGDTFANILIYVPIGVFLRLVFRRRGSSRLREWALSFVVACGLSYLTEVAQTVISARVASWPDVWCNSIGAVLGIVLAPTGQRSLRNIHASLYDQLRTAPMAAAAAVVLFCVCLYALAPLDVKPTLGHVNRSIDAWRLAPDSWLWGFGHDRELDSIAVMDKIVAAGSYGLLAFMLVLSVREVGGSPAWAAWHAASRSMALVLGLELIQLFTVSHSADPRDLLTAWLCCGLGSVSGCILTRRRPDLHKQPLVVLRGLMTVISGVILLWAVGSIALSGPPDSPTTTSWWPGVGNFHRSWDGVLSDYTTGLLEYTIVAGLLALWCRSVRRWPGRALVMGGTLSISMLAMAVSRFRDYNVDSTQFLLAILGASIAIYFDRLVFGKKRPKITPVAQ